mgnify:CR=1 FL=1
MPELSDIRHALKTTLEDMIPSLTVHPTVPDYVPVLPAALVIPFQTEYDVAMGRGVDTYEFDLMVLTSTNDMGLRQDELDEYVSGGGPKSIRRALFERRNLGLPGCDAHVAQMLEYGARFPLGDVEHLGARLRIIVHAKSS